MPVGSQRKLRGIRVIRRVLASKRSVARISLRRERTGSFSDAICFGLFGKFMGKLRESFNLV